MKHCPQCNRDLPETAFGLDNNRLDKLHPWCKECKNRKQRAKYAADPEVRAHKANMQRQLYSDPQKHEEQKQRQRRWYDEHTCDPDWRKADNERSAWHNRTDEQKAKKRLAAQRWAERNREHSNKWHREYVRKRYHADDTFKRNLRDYFKQRNHQKRANGGSFTVEEWQSMCLLSGYRCVKCGQIAELTVDHVVPVSEGGRNDLDNIQPLCMSCNASKGTDDTDYRPLTLVAAMHLSLQ